MTNKTSIPPMVLVTGAAHRIGRVIAVALAKAGYSVGLHFHTSETEARQTAVEIEKLEVPVHILQADLRDPRQIQYLFQKISTLPVELVGLVNSAALMPISRLDQTQVELWDDIFALNLRAAWLCSQQAARLILPRNGWIINITDTGAHKTWTKYAIYNLSKSALQDLTRLLARTYAPQIRVNAIAPGLILRNPVMPEDEWQHLQSRLPLHVSGQPEDIAQAINFLIQQPAITGQTITIDGGYHIL